MTELSTTPAASVSFDTDLRRQLSELKALVDAHHTDSDEVKQRPRYAGRP
jgi:hypothetical protein